MAIIVESNITKEARKLPDFTDREGIRKLEQIADRLDSLSIELASDISHFHRYVGRAKINSFHAQYALEHLDRIKDSIDRFYEGKPQRFEEK